MQLTKFSDYSLRLLIQLSSVQGRRLTARQIADDQGLSFNHLAKIAQWLAAEGYVTATRGRAGGISLAMAPSAINLGTLLRRSEAGSALVECMDAGGGQCLLTPACGLKSLLANAHEAFFVYLDNYTLADVMTFSPGMSALIAGLMDPVPNSPVDP